MPETLDPRDILRLVGAGRVADRLIRFYTPAGGPDRDLYVPVRDLKLIEKTPAHMEADRFVSVLAALEHLGRRPAARDFLAALAEVAAD